MPPINVARHKSGKRKGQFVKKNVLLKREKILTSVAKARAVQANTSNSDGPLHGNSNPLTNNTRRIVELDTLSAQLWCQGCKVPLSLTEIVHEKRKGLASVFHIKCKQCNIIREVETNRRNAMDRSLYDVNAKLAFAMIDAGIGETHITTLFSAIDVPTPASATIKKYERKVGQAIEEVSEESCIAAIRLERDLTLENEPEQNFIHGQPENDSTDKNIVHLKASYDSGWQKRGTGRSYNSLSGHGTAIGYYSGKVIAVGIRCKDCRFCKRGHSTTDHDCRLNYDGSAKSMEASIAVELFVDNPIFKRENVDVRTLIGDEDSCTIASVRREAGYEVEKWSDYNHVKKSFTSALYVLKLSPSLIDYFGKLFAIAIKQNKGEADKMERALQAIVPHAYGDHSLCGSWCEGNTSDEYIHKYLPQGKPLVDVDLKIKLSQLISRYSSSSQKIAQCGSTQANESLNQVISSKNPKSRHYAGSESMTFRIKAAICQKNLGCQYSSFIYNKMGISQSFRSESLKKQKDYLRQMKLHRARKTSTKFKRQLLKKKRVLKNASVDKKEGVTYESGFTLTDVSNLIIDPTVSSVSSHEKVNLQICKVVIYDLETTGLSLEDEIVQISLDSFIESKTFNTYIIPSKSFTKAASQITGLHVLNGELHLHENCVQAVSAKVACQNLIKYLQSFDCPIILLAHNGFTFDNPRLIRFIERCQMYTEFGHCVKGFVDSLMVFRTILQERRKQKGKFSIAALLNDYIPDYTSQGLHNAIQDVEILKKLLLIIAKSETEIKKYAKSISQINDEKRIKAAKDLNKTTLMPYKDILSPRMINKMSAVGVTREIMQAAFNKNGKEGLRILFTESVNGKPRVTKDSNVLEKVYQLFTNE